MKCSVCGKNIYDDEVTLFRNGPTGEIVEWRCEPHLDPKWRREDVMVSTAEVESLLRTHH